MKKIIGSLLLFSIIGNAVDAQTVSGSIRRKTGDANTLEILAKPTANINAQVGNINVTFSIPDQGVNNPTEASITKTTTLTNVTFAPTDGNNPYIIAGRAYYSYLILPLTATDQASSLIANTDNVIGSFTFSSPYNSDIRLEDLTSSGGGPNFQMTWYVQFNQGIGDVTDYANPFYGYYNAADAVNNGGTAQQYVTLVVKFTDFSVIKRNNDAILNWSVENEDPNTATYEIQKSLDGVNFSPVKNVAALNNGRSTNTYSSTVEDLSAIRSSGVIYFRIKQIDRDGRFVYTGIKSVRLDGKNFAIGVYPNPVRNTANVSFELEANAEVAVTLTDAAGKIISTKQLQGIKGSNITPLNMSNLASGTYTLKVQTGSDVKVIPVVKADN